MVESLVNSLLFKPPVSRPYTFPSRLIQITTKHKEQIVATFIKCRGATVTLLYSHGNAEDLNSAYSWMRRLSRELQVNVIGYDYTGYGLSSGSPSEFNCYSDIEAVFNYLRLVRGIHAHQIVLYGRSLGSGPSCWLAAKSARIGESVGGLILHSPFTSVYRVVVNLGFTMVGDKFCNVDVLPEVTASVIIMHGRRDEVVPFWHGVELQQAVHPKQKTNPVWMEGVGHNDHGPMAEALLLKKLNQYLDYYILARRLWMKPSSSLSPPSSPSSKNSNSAPASPGRWSRRTVEV